MELRVGDVVSERFRVTERRATGGMGVVYRATDLTTGAAVALKLLRSDASDEGLPRFRREASAVAKLSHPNIVRFVADGAVPSSAEITGEWHFLAMEWLEGEDLAQRLRRGPLAVAEALEVGRCVADALGHAHARGVIHRDVKPSNIILCAGDAAQAKLVDFGLALFASNDDFRTRTGITLGTAGYLSPEQARGLRVGPTTDVFALGCVLYKCIVGQGPFAAADAVGTIAKLLVDEPPRLSSLAAVPPALDDLVHDMLAKDPAARPQNGAEASQRIATIASDTRATVGLPAPAPSLTTRERRLVSVVVAARASLGDAEQTLEKRVEALDVSDGALRPLAERMGARIERLPGAVIATLFDHGSATDQAAHAARLALALRPLVGDVPIALATGQAEIGERSVGEAIDRAVSRATSAARLPAHEAVVWIDDVTAGLLGPEFRVERRAGALVLLGDAPRSGTVRTLLGKATPCVGRVRELAHLDALVSECEEDSVARAMIVVAPSGVGKSRLRHEWLQRLLSREKPPEVWLARADSLTTDSAFAVLVRCLRQAMELTDAPLSLARARIRSRVESVVPAASVARVAEFLGELCDVPMNDEPSVELRAARRNPMLMGDQLRRAWEDWITAECAASPKVIAIEDLHCCDRPTVQFLEYALRRAANAPLCVVAFARPEVDQRFENLFSGRAHHIHLPPLGARPCAELVRAVLGDVDKATIDRIVHQADGNAFFLEEIMRAVAEGHGEDVPQTVVATVQRRLEQLEPDARRVLRGASVFGDACWSDGLSHLLGAKQAVDWLPLLAERELLSLHDGSRLPGQREWGFRHALVREAAYSMLTETDRTLGHRLAAEWLESHGEHDAATLAAHYELGGVPDRAASHYAVAARRALGGNDLGAVIERADRGIACLGATRNDTTLGELHVVRAEGLRWMGKIVESEQSALEAVRWLPKGTTSWFAACAELSTSAANLGHADVLASAYQAVSTFELPVPSSPERVAAYVLALARIAGQLLTSGKRDLAEPLIARALARQTDALVESFPEVAAGLEQVQVYWGAWSGDQGSCYEHARAARALYLRAGDRRNAAVQAGSVGSLAASLGAIDAAATALTEVLGEFEALGMTRHHAMVRSNLAEIMLWQGRFEESIQMQREALAALDILGDVRMQTFGRCYLARALAGAGRSQEALATAAEALVSGGMLPSRAAALATLADIELSLSMNAEALDHARQAYEMLESLGGLEGDEALVRIVYVDALAANRQTDRARRVLAGAAEALRALASKIHDPKLKESFLSQVPSSRRTVQRAQEWGIH